MTITVRAVTPQSFADLARLFEAKGGPSYCWCMAWRSRGAERDAPAGSAGNAARKAQLLARLNGGEPIGLLAYDGETPAGWCSSGPLASFARFGGPKDLDPLKTWAISCFYVPRARRGQGIAKALAEAALVAARAAGAEVMQVTGVQDTSPSYRHMGRIDFYARLGFEDIGMVGTRRHLMRRVL